MAVTRIKNNQITDSTITAAKIASGTLTGGLFAADITLASNVTITGNLTVSGATDSISATNTYVNDPLVVFNNGYGGAPSYDIGILVNRNLTSTPPYGSVNASWIWRESDKAFEGLMTTETGATTGTINNSGFANLKIGNVTANSLTLTTGTFSAPSGITGTPISGSTGYFTTLNGTAFSTANAVITGGSVNGTVIGNATPASGWFTTLYGANFSTGNAVISGGYISALTNATVTTGTFTTLNAGTATAAVLNATAGNITTLYTGSLNTANAVITGGYVNGLANLTATTSQATNFSSGNIYATGSTSGTWSTANVSLYQQLATTSVNANLQVPLYDKTTGNAAAYTNGNFLYNPLTNTLFIGTLVTNGGNIGSTGGSTSFSTLYVTNFSTGNAQISGGSTTGLTNFSATTAQATNLSSGNIYATGSTAGTWSTANVSLYQQLAAGAQSANVYIPFYDKATGNAAAYTNNNILFTPSTGTLYVPNLITNSASGPYYPTLVVGNLSTGNAVISGGYISSLTNATITTGTFTTLNAATATAATLNATAGNITTLSAGSVNTGNAVITGGYINNLANLTATTAFATNFSSGNIYATGTTNGTWSTANVSLFDSVTALTTNQSFYLQFSNISTTGNSITGVNSSLSYNPSTGTLSATVFSGIGAFSTLQATNFSTGNAQITGGTLSGLTAITATTANFGTATSAVLNASAANVTGALFTSSLNTANAVITGGYVNSLANLTATTAQATNFSTGNAQITGGTLSGLTAVTATTGNFGTATAATLNATAGNITTLSAGSVNTANAVVTGGYVNGLSNLTATTAQVTNFSTGNAVISGGYISSLTNATITTATVTNGATTTLVATNFSSGNVAITGGYINSLANLTATTAQATNFSTGNARITGGYADNFPIGANTAATGAFTTLTSSGATTVTSAAGSTSTTTGALVVTGGVGIGGNLWVGGLTNIAGNVTIGGNLTVTGNSVSIGASTLSINDPIINLNTSSDLTPLTVPTVSDIGLKLHYYDTLDSAAFLGRTNSDGYLTWWARGSDTANVFTGTQYGTIKAGATILANARVVGGGLTANTGTLQVYGDGSISGNLYVGGNLTPGNVSTSMTTGTVMGNVGNFNNIYGTFYGTVVGTGAGGASVASANVSFYQQLANGTVNQSHYVPFYDKATGNAAAYTNSALTFNPSTGVLFDTTLSATNATITTLVAPNFSSANAVITGGSVNGTVIGNSTPASGWFTTLYGTNFSTGNAVISGGYISSLTNATVTTASITNLAATTATATNLASGNVAITGGYVNSLANLTATTAQATNFSSGNIYFTNATSGTVSTANVSLYQQLASTNVNANLSIPLHDKSTGNAASLTSSNIAYNPFTNTLFIGMIVTNGGNIGSTGEFGNTTTFSSLYATNFSTANAVINGGYISSLSNLTVTTGNIATLYVGTLNTTNSNTTTGYFGNLNTANAVITGGYVNGLSNLTATTAQVTNFSTGNAVISGGYISALTNATITTATITNEAVTTEVATNFSSGNIRVSGGYISALSNITATTANFGTDTTAVLNATAGNITTLSAGSINTANAVITGGYINSLANLTATTAQATNFSTGNAQITGGTLSGLTAVTATTGNFGTATAATLNSTAGNITTLYAGSLNTANAVVTGGYINNLANLTATTAQATNFSSGNIYATGTTNGTWSTANVSLYDSITATSVNGTFYPQVVDKATGNVAAYTVSSFTVNPSTGVLSATTFSGSGASLTNLPATAVVGTVATANVALYDSITASTTNANFYPQLVDKATGNVSTYSAAYVTVNPSTNTLSANVFSGAVSATTVAASSTVIASGNIVAGSGTASTSTTTGALVVVGGTGISGNITAGQAATFNSSQTAGYDFVVKGKTDATLIWARPGASYDQVVVGNSATTSTLVTGAKLIINSTDSMMIPAGTTAQRPSSTGGTDTAGMIRYNSTSNVLEFYNGSSWSSASSVFTTVTDTQFNGDGGTLTFTSANFAAATTNGLIVSINGVVQIPSLAYSLSGSTITFTEAPASGDVIDVRVILTTTAVTSIASANGFMSVSADNNGVNITSTQTIFTGNVVPQSNLSYNLGTPTAWWNTLYGVSTQAKYADLAENYQADKAYNPGTVLMFGGTYEVTLAEAGTTAVAGVVSTNPAHLMNGQLSGSNVVPLALTGRVPCMVIGPVRKGDMMVSAGFGYARSSTTPTIGQVIGKSVEDYPLQAKGVIEVVVGRV